MGRIFDLDTEESSFKSLSTTPDLTDLFFSIMDHSILCDHTISLQKADEKWSQGTHIPGKYSVELLIGLNI